MKERLIAEFDANYGRTGKIQVADATCDVCQQAAPCIVIDQSEGEYEAGHICAECARKAFGS
jgi:hypothetical protein